MNACVWLRVVMETASACESLSEGNWISPKIRERKTGGGRGLMHLSTASRIMCVSSSLLFWYSDFILSKSESYPALQSLWKISQMCLMTFEFTLKCLTLDGWAVQSICQISIMHAAGNAEHCVIKTETMQQWLSHFQPSLSFFNPPTLKIGGSLFETERGK